VLIGLFIGFAESDMLDEKNRLSRAIKTLKKGAAIVGDAAFLLLSAQAPVLQFCYISLYSRFYPNKITAAKCGGG
jgi:hypothetical protein